LVLVSSQILLMTQPGEKLLPNGEHTLLVLCLYYMSPINHKRTTSSLVPSIFYLPKNLQLKDRRLPIQKWSKVIHIQ